MPASNNFPPRPATDWLAGAGGGLTPIPVKSKVEMTADAIMEKVLDGSFRADQSIPTETALAGMLGVARGTVREAVKTLISQNVLEIRRGRGTFICSHNKVPADPLGFRFQDNKIKLGADICDARRLIEPYLAAEAATHATVEQLATIQRAHEQLVAAINAQRPHVEHDIQFHCAIAACTDNFILNEMLKITISGIRHLTDLTGGVLVPETLVIHTAIWEAIARHRAEAAHDAMEKHLLMLRDSLTVAAGRAEATAAAV